MSLPTSEVAICNLALDLLKEKPISDIDTPTTDVESLCARWYDQTRTTLIQSRNWSFASKSEAISRGGTPSVSIYADYYTFPNDYLRLTSIVNPNHSLTRYKYHIESNKILINNSGGSTLDIWFMYDNDTVTEFPPLFTQLLAARLALVVAHKITAKPKVIETIQKFIITAEKEALAFNGQERPPTRYENSKIVSSGLFPSTLQQVAGDYEFDFTP
jgi:hypothetical protein